MSTRLEKLVTFVQSLFWRKERLIKIKESEMIVGIPNKLTIRTLDSYDLIIYCQKKRYEREIDRWFFPVRNQVSYLVYAVPVGNAPAEIVEACEETYEVLALSPDFLWDELQRQIAVRDYIDILAERLKAIKEAKQKK